MYGPLDVTLHKDWKEKYPPKEWPVLAFVGAPASYPIQKVNVGLQKYLKWNDQVENEASQFIKENFNDHPFIGIHMRNGPDWVRKKLKAINDLLLIILCFHFRNVHVNSCQVRRPYSRPPNAWATEPKRDP